MQNFFGKVKCQSCQQYKLQPTTIYLLYFGLFLTLLSNFAKYLPLNLSIVEPLWLTGMGLLSIIIYFVLPKVNYVCRNCGKIYSDGEFQNLVNKQNVTITNSTKSSNARFFIIVFVLCVLAGGIIYYKVGNALQIVNKIEQSVPVGNAHWDKAQSLFSQIRNEKNIEKIEKLDAEIVLELKAVLEEQPNNARVWYELGNAYSWISLLGGDPEVRLSAYQKAESLEPNNFLYINSVGDQLISMKRYNDAILELQKAIRVGPNSFTYLSLAQAYRGAKIYDLAKQNYQKAIDSFASHNDGGKWDAEILQAQQEMATLPK